MARFPAHSTLTRYVLPHRHRKMIAMAAPFGSSPKLIVFGQTCESYPHVIAGGRICKGVVRGDLSPLSLRKTKRPPASC
jgi:hypothetical protein